MNEKEKARRKWLNKLFTGILGCAIETNATILLKFVTTYMYYNILGLNNIGSIKQYVICTNFYIITITKAATFVVKFNKNMCFFKRF